MRTIGATALIILGSALLGDSGAWVLFAIPCWLWSIYQDWYEEMS